MIHALIALGIGAVIVAYDWQDYRRSSKSTRWLSGLALAFAACIYLLMAWGGEQPSPASRLIYLLLPITPAP